VETTERAHDIISREILKINDDTVIMKLPSIASINNTIRRARSQIIGNCESSCVDIPDILKVDCKNNLFVRYDSGKEDPSRCVILFSKYKEEIISKIDVIVIDGTFRSSPPGILQLVVVHGYAFGKYYSCFYILMTDMCEVSYFRSLSKCLEFSQCSPTTIVTDFERALINAVQKYSLVHFVLVASSISHNLSGKV
jgi:hypothetical protein